MAFLGDFSPRHTSQSTCNSFQTFPKLRQSINTLDCQLLKPSDPLPAARGSSIALKRAGKEALRGHGLGALVGTQIQVCMFSLPNPPQGGLDPSNLFNIAHLGFVGREHGDFGGGGPLER